MYGKGVRTIIILVVKIQTDTPNAYSVQVFSAMKGLSNTSTSSILTGVLCVGGGGQSSVG